jgi:hypothetical protein
MTPSAGFTPAGKSIILIILCMLFSWGCATVPKPLPQPQLSLPDAQKIVEDIKSGNDAVRSFYSTGVVSIKGWLIDSDADILIAGIKAPLEMKIEITHSWGKPLLHVLIKNDRLEVFSFQEKTLYAGRYSPEALSRFLPGLELSQEMIWAVLGSRPLILSHAETTTPGPGRIAIIDGSGREIETVFLPVTEYIPAKLSLTGQSLDVSFSDIRSDNGISYAGEMEIKGLKNGKDLGLKINSMSMNQDIPEEIFTMGMPSSYKTINLDDLQGESVR